MWEGSGASESILKTGGNQQEAAVSTYAIVTERADDGGYGAWSPDLPGCVALGDTEEETLSEMKEAMRGHLELMRHPELIDGQRNDR
jgi:predicted RNase H-like HicB family nuclease